MSPDEISKTREEAAECWRVAREFFLAGQIGVSEAYGQKARMLQRAADKAAGELAA